jgi:hypothetical protein
MVWDFGGNLSLVFITCRIGAKVDAPRNSLFHAVEEKPAPAKRVFPYKNLYRVSIPARDSRLIGLVLSPRPKNLTIGA